ncbi:hypothetical protein ACF0H5_001867 [Mactra antiquata]
MSSPNTLLKAVTAGRSRQVRLLLDLGASLEEQDDCGQTPLIRAVLLEHDRNRDKIIRILLKRGAIVSKADVVGRNALMWACLYGRDNDVKLLIEHADVDCDFNLADINGQTALFHAVTSGNAATVKLVVTVLMKYGLSTDTTDNRGVTPLMHAVRLKHDICESILIYEGNAKIGLRDFDKYNKKDKWAITSLRDRSRVKITREKIKQSQFPPIDGEHKGLDIRMKHSDADDSLSSEEENVSSELIGGNHAESLGGNIYSPLIGRKNTQLIKSFHNISQCTIPPSVFVSLTGSGVGNATSSDDESEDDSVASTIVEGKAAGKLVVPSADIVAIYGIKQEQMSTSYRQTAVKVSNPVVEDRTDTPILKGNFYLSLSFFSYLCR